MKYEYNKGYNWTDRISYWLTYSIGFLLIIMGILLDFPPLINESISKVFMLLIGTLYISSGNSLSKRCRRR